MQEWYLGQTNVSCSEMCPQFRSVLIERSRPFVLLLKLVYILPDRKCPY